MEYIKPTKISIRYLYRDWLGWSWYWECVVGSNRHRGCHHTDEHGRGVWSDDTLISGNEDFRLDWNRNSAYQKIRRWIIKQYRMPLDMDVENDTVTP